jgi:predicted acyl esterase
MSDGVRIAWTLRFPNVRPPAGGLPAIILEHGGSETRESEGPVLTARDFTRAGYVTLTYDRRGNGGSTGAGDLASPRDVSDLRALRSWLARQPGVSDTAIGAWGGSVGGAVVLNAVAAGVPFAAVTVLETWTDLARALFPQGVARSMWVNQLFSLSPSLSRYSDPASHSARLGLVGPLLAARSALPGLRSARTPIYLFQGRDDWLFDVDQATRAFVQLTGPRKLYIGAFGHAPSSFPGPDFAYVSSQWHRWFDHFLKGVANGVQNGPPVALARADGTRHVSYQSLPPTTLVPIALHGHNGVRVSAPLPRPLETFGGAIVRVTVSKLSDYPRLVASLLLFHPGNRFPFIVSEGGIRPRLGNNTIRLADDSVLLPAGAHLELQLGPGSQTFAAGSYIPYPEGTATLGTITLTLSTLKTPISG